MSRALLTASRTRTAAPAASCWRSSTRPSAGCVWRNAFPYASSSTMCRLTCSWRPGARPPCRWEREAGGEDRRGHQRLYVAILIQGSDVGLERGGSFGPDDGIGEAV